MSNDLAAAPVLVVDAHVKKVPHRIYSTEGAIVKRVSIKGTVAQVSSTSKNAAASSVRVYLACGAAKIDPV